VFLTPHRTDLSFATLACLPTRPVLLRLRTRPRPSRLPSPLVQPHTDLFSEQNHMPSRAICLSLHPSSLTSKLSQAIQTP
jgi:hypothetical protein